MVPQVCKCNSYAGFAPPDLGFELRKCHLGTKRENRTKVDHDVRVLTCTSTNTVLQQQMLEGHESQAIFKKAGDVASTYYVGPEDAEFSFDDVVVSSTAYHRAFAQQQARNQAVDSDLGRTNEDFITGRKQKEELVPIQSSVARHSIDSSPGKNSYSSSTLPVPLQWAMRKGFASVVQSLLDGKTAIDGTYRTWDAFMIVIAMKPQNGLVNEILLSNSKKEGNINVTTTGGLTPLHLACMNGGSSSRLKIIQLLLDNDADFNSIASFDHVDGHDIDRGQNSIEYSWCTLLQIAYRRGLEQTVALLLSHCGVAAINRSDSMGHTFVHYVAGKGDLEMWPAVSTANTDLNVQSENGTTPLHYACSAPGDCLEFVEVLFKRLSRAQQIHRNKIGELSLHYAAAEGNTRITEYLFKKIQQRQPPIERFRNNTIDAGLLPRPQIYNSLPH
ncbi:ankyrin [Pleomassaria siparia CBS 279.74]|uniref:Ankyrin n=1 Tax=Pleomassaria siparia CBS 279.74 TaxID=1314801 RepID=A0A6G1KTG4_9PLEO|nr:ankyrin [Pleomassaria siparia CBS 279.74]